MKTLKLENGTNQKPSLKEFARHPILAWRSCFAVRAPVVEPLNAAASQFELQLQEKLKQSQSRAVMASIGRELERAEGIQSRSDKAIALADIARAQAAAGMAQEAFTTFEKALELSEGNRDNEVAFRKIATEMANAGLTNAAFMMFEAAKTDARKKGDSDYIANHLTWVAQAQIEGGLMADAAKTLQEALIAAKMCGPIRPGPFHIGRIAQAQATAGLEKDALNTFDIVLHISKEPNVWFYHVVEPLISVGMLDRALKVAHRIKNRVYKSLALARVSLALGRAGRAAESRKTHKDALRATRNLNAHDKAWVAERSNLYELYRSVN